MLPAEKQVLEIIRQHIELHGYAPTLAEIADASGLRARSQIHGYVNSLIEQGYLERQPRVRRGLRLVQQEERPQYSIPLAGKIAAGQPIEAINGGEELDLRALFLQDDRYPLRVQGDSMIDIGLQDGDIVIIQHRQTARNGEIVVALVDGQEATLKRFFHHPDGRIELRPENPQMQSMIYPSERIRIQGVLVCSLRMYD